MNWRVVHISTLPQIILVLVSTYGVFVRLHEVLLSDVTVTSLLLDIDHRFVSS